MLVGYIRVSTDEQNLDLQRNALLAAGVDPAHIFEDRVSGAKTARPGLDACLKVLRRGDTLLIWRLDRLGRSLKHMVQLAEELKEKEISLKSLHDGIEARAGRENLTGDLVFKLFAVLAEFERNLVRERTMAGLKAARARGRQGGRPKGPRWSQKVKLAKQLSKDTSLRLQDILDTLGLSKSTYYRYIQLDGDPLEV